MAKRALTVGINQYRGLPGNNLSGCVNDAHNLARMLSDVYGFAHVDTLADAEASRCGILDALEDLTESAQPGDELVFAYSGHGTQTADRNGDEPDRMDEALCPADLTDANWNRTLIVDDELSARFLRLPAGVNLTVIMDCCHSGSITRDIVRADDPRPRFLAPRHGTPVKFGPRRHRLARSLSDTQPWLCLSGCQDEETSADDCIDGVYEGALTHAILCVARGNPSRTWDDAHKRALHWLEREGYDQHPVLSGAHHLRLRRMFGGAA